MFVRMDCAAAFGCRESHPSCTGEGADSTGGPTALLDGSQPECAPGDGGRMKGELEARLIPGSNGCTVQLRGELVRESQLVVHIIEAMVASDPRVVLDLSGVTAVDLQGLEAVLKLMDAVRSGDGHLLFGGEDCANAGAFGDIDEIGSSGPGVKPVACQSVQFRGTQRRS